MVVAPREEQAYVEPGSVGATVGAPPRQHHASVHAIDDAFVHDRDALGTPIRPSRPRFVGERCKVVEPARMKYVGHVVLRGQGEAPRAQLHPRLESVDEHDAIGRWAPRREQQRVVASRAISGDGAGREPARAVGLQPFGTERQHAVHGCGSVTPAASLSMRCGGLPCSAYSPYCWISLATTPVHPVCWLPPTPPPR